MSEFEEFDDKPGIYDLFLYGRVVNVGTTGNVGKALRRAVLDQVFNGYNVNGRHFYREEPRATWTDGTWIP